jgi:hypothetical protein
VGYLGLLCTNKRLALAQAKNFLGKKQKGKHYRVGSPPQEGNARTQHLQARNRLEQKLKG